MPARLLVCAVVAVLTLWASFLGDFFLSENLLKTAWARISAPLIAKSYADGAKASLAVVHLDANALEASGGVWPVPYGYHAGVLRRIAAFRPRLIFVDFTFESARDDQTLKRFTDTLCDIQHQGIEVLLAGPATRGPSRLREELEVVRAQGCFRLVSIEQIRAATDRGAWEYPLFSQASTQASTQSKLPSAALAIAQVMDERFRPGQPAWPGESDKLAMIWGLTPAQNSLNWMVEDAEAHTLEQYCQPWTPWRLLPAYLRASKKKEIDEPPVCVFHESIAVERLLSGNSSFEEARRLEQLLKGRAVLYGASFNNDFVYSPIQGEIPGVYLHAMAADNLLTFGTEWKHEPKDPSRPLAGFHLASYFLITLVSWLVTDHVRACLGLIQVPPRLRDGCLWLVSRPWAKVVGIALNDAITKPLLRVMLPLALGGVVWLFGYFALNWGPMALMDVVIFSTLTEAIGLRHEIARALGSEHVSRRQS